MKNIIAILLCSQMAWADASLTFSNSTNVVSLGAGSALTNIINNNFGSLLVWLNPSAVPAAANAMFFSQSGTGSTICRMTTTGVLMNTTLTTTTQLINVAYANIPTLTASHWSYLLFTWKLNGANTDQKLYYGDQTHAAVEVTTYATQRAGVGTITVTTNTFVGNINAQNQPFIGQIGEVVAWNRILTPTEVKSFAYNAPISSTTVYFANMGFDGLGSQKDLSGNGNTGIVGGAGASVSTSGPPIFVGGTPL